VAANSVALSSRAPGQPTQDFGPVGVGARAQQVGAVEKRLKVAQGGQDSGLGFAAGFGVVVGQVAVGQVATGHTEQPGQLDLVAEHGCAAEVRGIEAGGGVAVGLERSLGEIGREQQRGDGVERKRMRGPMREAERVGDERQGGQRRTCGELPGGGREVGANGLEFWGEGLTEGVFEAGAGVGKVRDKNGDAGRGIGFEQGTGPAGGEGKLVALAGGGGPCMCGI
jgi:hypothetical protein